MMKKNTLLTIVGIVILVAIGIHMVLGFVVLLNMEINPEYSTTEILLIVAGFAGLVIILWTIVSVLIFGNLKYTCIGVILLLMMAILVGLILVSKSINPDYSHATTTTTIPAGNRTVTILEYSDFQCPYCARAENTMKEIKKAYGDRVEIIFKHFPLPFHSYAEKAAEASECARDQGKFEDYHYVLFENQNNLGIDSLKEYASRLGIDRGKFDNCLDSGEKAEIVKSDHDEGASKGVTGTPTFFINGKKLVGAQPFENFKAVIDSELKG